MCIISFISVRQKTARTPNGSAPLGSKGPPLPLRSEVIAASDHVRVLGVTVSSDLSLQMHVSSVCSLCFYWLRQIRRIRRSLDTEFARVPHVLGCESICTGCQNLHHHRHLLLLLSTKADTHFTVPQRVEG